MNKASYVFILLGILILAVLGFFVYQSQKTPTNPTNQNSLENEIVSPSARILEIVIDYKTSVLFEPKSYRVSEGNKVSLTITSDKADEVHMHGYDIVRQLTAGQQTTVEFIADKTGRFEFELHDSSTTLGYIEVYPN
jgi:heme/copper-type cytochrome/quinol oxidase subunit 2